MSSESWVGKTRAVAAMVVSFRGIVWAVAGKKEGLCIRRLKAGERKEKERRLIKLSKGFFVSMWLFVGAERELDEMSRVKRSDGAG